MSVHRILFVKIFLLLFEHSRAHCDTSLTARVPEGNLHQSGVFNWLGVLKVHLHDGDKWHVAVSGIVLIKVKYALANADDVARIPEHVFKSDSLAVFLAAENSPWSVAPLSYVTHPEYEYATFNSIAIIELNTDEADDYPLNPICLPGGSFNTSGHLYLTGYTDENEVLEKVIYKIQYLEKHVCEEFYDRAGLSAPKRAPTSYMCGFAPRNSSHCVWDNGMALVSNATGWFTLIGFGIRGPGCAAPARFIDMLQYFPWIQSATSNNMDMYDDPDYRRKGDDDEFVPIHDLFMKNNSRKHFFTPEVNVLGREYLKYPFDVEKPRHFEILPTDDENTLAIYPFDEMHEQFYRACTSPRVLMYHEYFNLRVRKGTSGVARYKLTMFDLVHLICTCVRLTVVCDNRTQAILSFRELIHFHEGTRSTEAGETPEEVFKYFTLMRRTVPTTGPPAVWQPDLRLVKPSFIREETKVGTILNYDLYIKFEFTDWAVLKFQLFAGPDLPQTTYVPKRRRGPSLRAGPKVTAMPTKKRDSVTAEPDNMVREPEVTVVTAHEEVFHTVSGVFYSRSTSVYLLLGCLLTSVAF